MRRQHFRSHAIGIVLTVFVTIVNLNSVYNEMAHQALLVPQNSASYIQLQTMFKKQSPACTRSRTCLSLFPEASWLKCVWCQETQAATTLVCQSRCPRGPGEPSFGHVQWGALKLTSQVLLQPGNYPAQIMADPTLFLCACHPLVRFHGEAEGILHFPGTREGSVS